ncbi:hypothetical protein EV127DRAFT_408883 [Xylaria flabelliformis]|nr:hypothetical protein EV127DRAFT_408883 [Xylaria flabelliformis]
MSQLFLPFAFSLTLPLNPSFHEHEYCQFFMSVHRLKKWVCKFGEEGEGLKVRHSTRYDETIAHPSQWSRVLRRGNRAGRTGYLRDENLTGRKTSSESKSEAKSHDIAGASLTSPTSIPKIVGMISPVTLALPRPYPGYTHIYIDK